jgi:acetyl-CoA carboxylase biotin carboxyl carrier protein
MANGKENPLSNGLKKEISSLYELMRNEKLEELEIEEEDFYVYLKRKGKTVLRAVPQAVPSFQGGAGQEQSAGEAQGYGETIKSPIMGVFYRAPSPSSPSFVKEGDVVVPGKNLCIIEAMKVMNEIKTEFKVRVVKILVENGNPVTAGQDLFVVERA